VPVNGALSGAAPNLIYTPNANFNGSDSFTFKVNDGELDSVPATVSISITPVNDAPVANNLSVITMEDTPVAMTLTGSDVEGSPLTFTVLSNPSLGTLSGTPPNLTYTPNGNANGPDSFTFKVNDGELDSVPATVSINITPVNDGPTLSDIPNQTIPANSTTGPVPFTVNDADNDPATLSVSGSSDYQLLVPDGNIVFGGSGADRTLTVTPAPDQSGTATITVTISDGVAVASKSFIVTVTTGNHAPIADASASETTAISHNKKNAMVTLDGSRSFDPDNDRLTYSWREYTTNLGSGAVLHEKLSVGTHVITLTVSDGSLIGTTTVTINVVTTVDAIGKLAKTMQASNLPIALKNELSASLKAAANMSLKGNMSACVNELRAFQKKVLAQSGKKIDRATAAALIRTAQTIINTISSR